MNNDSDYCLDSTKFNMVDNERLKCYVTIVEKEGSPYEVFFTFTNENDDDLKNKYANITCITRFISKCLAYDVPLTEIISQLEKSSRSKNDVPDLIRKALIVSTASDALSLVKDQNNTVKWTQLNTGRTVTLPKGVPGGDGWVIT